MTPDQKIALKQALDQHSFRMSIKDAAPKDFQVPSYSANTSPVYDNQLFPKITSADDLIKLGYATPEGVATENGEMAISLKKAGALNDDYTLNDTGKAMMANPADLLEEENLPLYIKAKELDLDGSGRELSWGEHLEGLKKTVIKGGKNLAVLLATASPTSSLTGRSPYEQEAYTDKERAALNLEAEAALGGLVKSGAAMATGVSKIAGYGIIKALADSEAEERLALSMFDQKFEKIDRDIQASKVSEVVDAMGQMAGAEFDAMGRMAGVELGLAGAGPDLTEARKKNIELVGEQEAAAIEKRGESAGQFAGMINPYGAAAMTGKVAFGVAGKGLGVAFKPISRSLLQADSKAALVLERTRQLASLERRAAGFKATAQAAERQAVIAESMAEKFSKAGLTDRANNALRLANQSREKGQELSTRLGGFTEEIAKVSDDLAKATQSAGVADKVLQMGQMAKQIPYLPVTAIGKTLELTGRGMIGIDKGLSTLAAKIGADKAYNAMNKISSLSGLGGAGAALGLGPAAFIPAAAKLAWATAPYIKAAGEYVSLVGKEASKARGQIGFWKRIYEMPNKGPAHRMVSGLMDTATAGGLVTGMGSRVTKGLLASYPVDLAYEWVSEGGELNPNLFKQAAVETLFFGGTGAALGGITMGSANRIKALQNGDAMNFYSSISDPAQRLMYNGMPSDLKRVVGTFSASNPGAKIQFVDQGLGAYDRNTKTVMINPNAPNPLKPLLTHEFMHHMLNSGIGDGVIANLVGDGFQTGGILRSKDGGYDAQYESFKGEYVNRLRKQHDRQVKLRDAIGDPMTKNEREFKTPDEKYLAEEYFIETNVDDMLGLVESGKLGKMAGRMIINDKVRALGDSILNKSAILRDLHFRIGGVMDNSGKMVTGNGFLSGKLYQSPEVRRMFQKMVSESVGRRGGIDAAKRKAREGVEISIQGKSDPILGELGSLWETDSDGSPLVDNNGDFVPLKKETDELRSQAGMLLVDDLKARQSRGEAIPDGELAYNPENNTWSGQYLNDKQIDLLSLSGRFNSKQIKQLRLLNEAARQTSNTNADPATRGHRFSMIYQPALKKNRKGQWKYDQIKPQLRDVVPYGVEISKDGNILIRIMSTNQLFANVSEKAASKRGRTLYDGNMETILRDANAVIDLHGKNQATDAYFKEKYAGKWEDHKKFINSVFGNVGAGHKDINPLVASDRVDAVVKSYRLDRMNKATQLVGSTQLPYQNNLIKINYLPEGEPIMDANGEPKDLRYGSRPVDQAMPEQRQMPEQATPVKRFTDQLTETPLGETFKVEVDGPLFRSVTQKDWDRIQEQGYLDSDQRYAVSKKEGVNMASSPLSAITYAPIGDNSVLLKINPSNIGLHGYAGDQYIRTWDRIKLEDIEDVGKFIGGETVPSYMSQSNESDIARKMPEVSPEDLNPVSNKQEAQRLFADGKRLFAVNEMDEKAAEITSVEMLNSYPADAIGWTEPEQAPALSQTGQMRFMPDGYKSHHDEALLRSAWNGKELDLPRPFKAGESLPSLAMRTKWDDKPLENKDNFDFKRKARVIFGKNKNGQDVTIKYDPNLLNAPSIVDFADVYTGEQIQYTIADRMSAVDGDMGGPLHPFLKNNDIVIRGPDGREYVVGWGNNSTTVGTKMRKKAKDGAKVLMVYLMGNDAHQSNTRTVRLFDTQLENSSMPSHMAGISRAYAYIAIKEIKHQSSLKEVERIDGLIQKAKESKKGSGYIDELKSAKSAAIKESQKIKVSAYDNELSGIFRKVKTSQTRLNNGLGKQSTVDANIKELSDFAASAKGKRLIGETPSKFIYEMTKTFDGRKSAVSQISNLRLYDFDGPALSAATADMEAGDKNAVVTAIDLSNDQDFFMLYMGNDPKQMGAMTASEKAAAAKLKQNSNFVIHEAYDTLILSPLDGRRKLNSRMENALDAVPDSFQDVLNDRPSVKAQVGKTNAKGNLILSEDNLLNTVRDQQSVPLIYNPKK